MKKFIKIITLTLTAILLFCSTAFFVGCDKEKIVEIEGGPIYSLRQVYEAKAISYNDLLSIACHSGNRNINNISESFVPKEIGELNEEISLKIRECIAENYRTREFYSVPDAKAEDVILYYYGYYKGYYAFRHNELYKGDGLLAPEGENNEPTWEEGEHIAQLFFQEKIFLCI